ncbi:MAG: tetratricopeptide repeat protein [Planctomycetota bacterium]
MAIGRVLLSVLCCGATVVAEEAQNPASLSAQTTPRQQAAAFLKGQVSEISEQLLNDFPKDIYFIQTAFSFHRLCKNYNQAGSLLKQASENLPSNFWVHHTAAQFYFETGEYEKALVYSRKALAISPDNSALKDTMADSLFHLGQYPEAVELLEDTITAAPASEESYWLLGQAYAKTGQLEEAKESYQKALQLNPRHSKGNYWLAKVCMRLKQTDEAKKYMQAHKAITDEEEQRRLAWAESRGHSDAVDTSETEIIAFPIALAGMSTRGYKLYQTQKNISGSKRLLDKTDAAFEKAITIDPTQHTVFREAAFFYLNAQQELNIAKAYAQKALALKRTAESYYILGLVHEAMSNYIEALVAFEQAMKLEPNVQKYRLKYNEMFQKN